MKDTGAHPETMLVLGVGNALLKDEGAGLHVARRLQQIPLPPCVEILEGGTLGFGLLGVLAGRKRIILVDAIHGGAHPGAVFRFRAGDIRQRSPTDRHSLHQVSLFDLLRAADWLEMSPPHVVVIAIQPEDTSPGTELSKTVEAVVPEAVNLVIEELAKGLVAHDSDP